MKFSGLESELKEIGFEKIESGIYTKYHERGHLSVVDLNHEKMACFEFRNDFIGLFARKVFPTMWGRSRAETLEAVKQAFDVCEKATCKSDIKKWTPNFRSVRGGFGRPCKLYD